MDVRRFFGGIVLVIVVIVGLILLVQAGRAVFNAATSNDEDETAVQMEEAQTQTSEQFIEQRAPFTFRREGEIVANEDHRVIEISISPSQRELRIISGYQNTVIDRKQFKNNEDAYQEFAEAATKLQLFATQEADYASFNGVCPTGERHIYTVGSASTEKFETWASSCSNGDGTLDGKTSSLRKLFEKQIPEYRELTKDVSL
jgi:hypothetical protein